MPVSRDYVEEIRRLRHQRHGWTNYVRIPASYVFDKNADSNKEIICAIICWVPKDHYLLALPSDVYDGYKLDRHIQLTSNTVTVPCGVCCPLEKEP